MTHDYYESMDLRLPVLYIARSWAWIVGASILAALAAVAISLWLPVEFEAAATVAIMPLRTEVQFDPRIQTLADDELVRGTLVTRRDALVALMKSNEVMQSVLAEVGDELEEEQQSIEWLRSVGSEETSGDLINLEVRYSDPVTAAIIANSWISHYARQVNKLYSARGNIEDSQILEQVRHAGEQYEEAQAALEAFKAEDQLEHLQRDLDATLAIIDSYQRARIATLTRATDRNQQILNGYDHELVQIESWLANATALREQVAEDTGSEAGNLGNLLALVALRSRVFGGQNSAGDMSGNGLDVLVDLSSPALDVVTVRDVDTLIAALEQRREAVQDRAAAFPAVEETVEETPQLGSLSGRIAQLSEEAAVLRAEIEAVTTEQRELTRARDNAWETYQLLQNRLVEEQVASQTVSSEVRVADWAIPPEEPVSRGVIRNAIIAGLVGTVVATGLVLVRAWWVLGAGDEAEAQPGPAGHVPRVDDDRV